MNPVESETVCPGIVVINVHKDYGNVKVLNGLNLELNAGETLVLTGPSGCGKTTTLRIIAGLERPDRGEVWLNAGLAGNPDDNIPIHKRSLSMIFQDLALWPHLTVRQHMDFVLDPGKYPRKKKQEKIEEILGRVRLEKLNSYPHQLSGGEQQRLAIARALAPEPDILLLDEPLASLDDSLKYTLLQEFRQVFRENKITVVYVTHYPEEAQLLADSVAIMEKGVIESGCTVNEFARRQQEIWRMRVADLKLATTFPEKRICPPHL